MRCNVEYLFRPLALGRLEVADLVSHRVAPTDRAAAYALLEGGRDEAMGVRLDLGV
jgi:threonine dehydrogenase-like Zn-dependent dehydrogenase